MKQTLYFVMLAAFLLAVGTKAQKNSTSASHWPQWRGPDFNGMARSDAPTKWSDKENVKWKVTIPGRGHSTPVVWGDKIFVTTAVPTGKTGNLPSDGRHPNGGE